jgi:hypothetical protein
MLRIVKFFTEESRMDWRSLAGSAAVSALVAAALPLSVQSQSLEPAARPFTPPPSSYTPPKTAWGDPDIQGLWDYQSIVPMQRPAALAGKQSMTEAEWAEWSKNNQRNQDACGVGTRADDDCSPDELASVGAYNEFWDNRNIVKDLRTSLIEDPPDGRIPAFSAEGQKKQAAWSADRAARRQPGRSEFETFADFRSVGRCISEQTPNGPQMYNSGTLIVQSPGWVMILRERLDTRMIPLSGRPHLDQNIRLWNGDSVGRWEGNTLVVDTTNFNNKQLNGGPGESVPVGISFENFHLVERFVPIGPNRIHYYATVEDPTTWVRPWTFMLPWERDDNYQIFEYACHEANISVENALRGARVQEELAARPKLPLDQTSASLMGATEAAIRARLGEPAEIRQGVQWRYETVGGTHVLTLGFADGVVRVIQPTDMPLTEIRGR